MIFCMKSCLQTVLKREDMQRKGGTTTKSPKIRVHSQWHHKGWKFGAAKPFQFVLGRGGSTGSVVTHFGPE